MDHAGLLLNDLCAWFAWIRGGGMWGVVALRTDGAWSAVVRGQIGPNLMFMVGDALMCHRKVLLQHNLASTEDNQLPIIIGSSANE